MREIKPSFYEILPDGRFQFMIDASMVKDFSLCEAYFHLRHVKNLRLRGHDVVRPFSMAIGSWWSSVMEDFYNSLRDGKELTQQGVQDIALKQWVLRGIDDCAAADPDAYKSFGDVAGAVLMLTEYFNNQYLIDKENWKVVGVEEGFGLKKEVLIGETRTIRVYWIGKPDLVVVENGRLTPVDSKTVSRIDGKTITLYKPSSQMAGYVFASKRLLVSLVMKFVVTVLWLIFVLVRDPQIILVMERNVHALFERILISLVRNSKSGSVTLYGNAND
jgi:hypothetical protein